ncbi:MAG: mechanosensitive ion channel domain-containing protein [Pseudomonadota bacterium]
MQDDPAPSGQQPAEAPQDAPAGAEGSALAELVEVDRLQEYALAAYEWVRTEMFTLNSGVQVAVVFGAIFPAVYFGPRMKDFIQRTLRKRLPDGALQRVADAIATLATPIAAWIFQSIALSVMTAMGQGVRFIDAAQSLLTAWIVVRLVTLAIRSPFWSKVAFYIAWPIAALDAFGVLGDVFDWMRTVSVQIAPSTAEGPGASISLLDVVRAGAIFAVFMQLASLAGGVIRSQIQKTDEINPSLSALIVKVLDFALPIIALVLALQMIGFNLASLAIFSGAVGLGVGLGLQKIISNFLAGFTLLADRSIKPGDVVEIDDTFGWVTAMKSRYVSIRTRDGTEHLMPNSKFMEEGVVNWSHNDRDVRIHAGVGVAYGTKDLRLVQTLCTEAAASTERVLKTPAPVCNLIEFGDSSVNFDLRFWISDPQRGIANVRSEILLKIWDALAEHEIEIPFPQRDLHIKSSDVAFGDAGRAGAT